MARDFLMFFIGVVLAALILWVLAGGVVPLWLAAVLVIGFFVAVGEVWG